MVAGAGAAPRGDHALLALNILPPGQGANTPDLTSQISMYDGLTPLQGNVTAKDLAQYYKAETLGLGGAKARQAVSVSARAFIVSSPRCSREVKGEGPSTEPSPTYKNQIDGSGSLAGQGLLSVAGTSGDATAGPVRTSGP